MDHRFGSQGFMGEVMGTKVVAGSMRWYWGASSLKPCCVLLHCALVSVY